MVNTLYIALLRGINVGGGNIIRMVDLKACFEANRMKNVATYIQGGNVVFESGVADHSRLADKFEKALSKAFKPYEARIVLRSHERLAQIVRKSAERLWQRATEVSVRCDICQRATDCRRRVEECHDKTGG
jgi:uncharacterized protein (DUF1697 family)